MQISDFSIVLTTGISERAIGRIRTEYKEKGVLEHQRRGMLARVTELIQTILTEMPFID